MLNNLSWCLVAFLSCGAALGYAHVDAVVTEENEGSDEPRSGGNVVDLFDDSLYTRVDMLVLDNPVTFVEFVTRGRREKIVPSLHIRSSIRLYCSRLWSV